MHAGLPGAENLSSVYDYQFLAAEREGVKFRTGFASMSDLKAQEPDTIVLATGATMLVPSFVPETYALEGLIPDLRQLITNFTTLNTSGNGRLVIIDRDHTEMTYAAAEFLSYRFTEVIIVTPRDRLASDCSLINRQKIYSRLYRCGVKIITSSEPANLDKLEEKAENNSSKFIV